LVTCAFIVVITGYPKSFDDAIKRVLSFFNAEPPKLSSQRAVELMPLKDRDFSDAINKIKDNMRRALSYPLLSLPAAKTDFEILVCGGTAGIGNLFVFTLI
jgi:hypothetical protein